MAKFSIAFLILMVSCLSMAAAARLKSSCRGAEKLRVLHFYVQDTSTGPNRAVWDVASSADVTTMDNMLFGQINVVDCLITAEPARNSTLLGHVQGLATASDFDIFAMTMDLNFYFTAGEYSGSTISVVGRNEIMNATRELPVVGGTGQFRMARGFAIVRNHSTGEDGNGILEYYIYAYTDEGYKKLLLAHK